MLHSSNPFSLSCIPGLSPPYHLYERYGHPKRNAAIFFWLICEFDASSFANGVEVFCHLISLVPTDHLERVIYVLMPDLGLVSSGAVSMTSSSKYSMNISEMTTDTGLPWAFCGLAGSISKFQKTHHVIRVKVCSVAQYFVLF